MNQLKTLTVIILVCLTFSTIIGTINFVKACDDSASKIVFSAGALQVLQAGTISNQITVQLQDESNVSVNAPSNITVNLATNASSSGHFYSDINGKNQISGITIVEGQNSANFYYNDTLAGHPTLNATSGTLTPASTTFTITGHMAAISIAITPNTASITAGASQAFTATASDGCNNWDVTGSIAWSIDASAGGSWVQSTGTYTSAEAGTWTVTGAYNGLTGTASLTVSPAGLDHITASVNPSSVASPGSVTGTATAYDAFGNSWDVSNLAVWSIPAGGDGGSWSGNIYTSNTAGTYAVQAEYLGMIATASLTVTHGEAYVDHIVIAPKEATVAAGVSQSYTTTAFNTFGNGWAVAAAYSCPSSNVIITGNSAYSDVAGTYIITATYSGQTDTATLTTTGYAVTFAETGLPTGTSWNVTFNSNVYSSTTNTITINGAPAQSCSWSTPQNIGNSQTQYAADQASGTISVPSQLTQNIQYTTQYLVSYAATGNVLSVSVPPTQWVNSGGQATGIFPSQVENGAADTRCNLVSDDRTTITQPTTVTATYQTQYYLTVTSPYSTTSGEGWYNTGITATASVTNGAVQISDGTQMVFSNWSGDSSGSSLTSNPIIMDGAKTATANWVVSSSIVNPTPTPDLNSGTSSNPTPTPSAHSTTSSTPTPPPSPNPTAAPSPTPKQPSTPLFTIGETALIFFVLLLIAISLLALRRRKKDQPQTASPNKKKTFPFF